jgi:hypothetical protein
VASERIVWTPEAEKWFKKLPARQRKEMIKALDAFAEGGPGQRWPRVGTIGGSRLHKMRELRSVGGHLRLLFANDNGRAVMLHGGDKTHQWNEWYPKNIKRAENAYVKHLRAQGRRPPWEKGGGRSDGRTP